MITWDNIDVLTFDCYGTLIDWETGILQALAGFRTEHPRSASDDEILERYAEIESSLQGGPYQRYRQILRGVMRGLAGHYGAPREAYNEDTIADSVAQWGAFPDTVESLQSLKQDFQLAIISNIDNELFEHSARRLGVDFDYVITAEDVGAYKPSHDNFLRAFDTIGLPRERILHVAQSKFHDIVPANALGITSVWVNRRHDRPGYGATAPAGGTPDLEVPDLATLARLAKGNSP